jgi:hypothetical protein
MPGPSCRRTPANGNPLEADAYRLAFADPEFLLRRETRGIRFQLEMLKPDLGQAERAFENTMVVFGSARFRDPDDAGPHLAAAQASGDADAIAGPNAACATPATTSRLASSPAWWPPTAAPAPERRSTLHLHRRRPRHHGSRQPRRARRGRAERGPEHRAAARAAANRLHHAVA